MREFGYQVEFYIEPTAPNLLAPEPLRQGTAIAQEEGQNKIHARLFKADVVIIDPETGLPIPDALWPGSLLGSDILGFLARGLAPATLNGELPVIVHPATAEIKLEPTLAFRAKPGDPLQPCPAAPNAPAGTCALERPEPFESQLQDQFQDKREYVLAVKVETGGLVTDAKTVKFKVRSVALGILRGSQFTPNIPPLAGMSTPRGNERSPKIFFSKVVEQNQEVSVEIKPGDTPVELKQGATAFAIKPNNMEEGQQNGPYTRLVPPGFNFAGRYAALSIELEADGGSDVTMTKTKLDVAVTNDETFEEYMRVTLEAEEILDGAGAQFSDFGKDFFEALKSGGHGTDLVRTHGERLWKAAYERVQGVRVAAVKDDRPLYWARLRGDGALRAYRRRKPVSLTDQQLEQVIEQFEWASRGMDSNGRIRVDDAPPNTRRVVVTGFDPFGLSADLKQSNPSGLVALELNRERVGSSQPPVHIRTAVFPVRYKEYDAGWIEKAFDVMDTLVMLVTVSENGSFDTYDIERWAAKNRLKATDNNNKDATGTHVGVDSNNIMLLDPGGATAGGDQFLQTTLPHKQVITDNRETRELEGPNRAATPFIFDQSYKVIDISSPPRWASIARGPTLTTRTVIWSSRTLRTQERGPTSARARTTSRTKSSTARRSCATGIARHSRRATSTFRAWRSTRRRTGRSSSTA